MHELAVTRSLIDLVEQEAEKQGFHRALEIRLKVGEYSGIVPECILDLFPYASKGTVTEGAALPEEAERMGLDMESTIDYDFEDAKDYASVYVEDFYAALVE